MSKNSRKVLNKNKQGMIFRPKIAQIWNRNFENLTPDLESTLPRYYVCQFLGKTDRTDFFGPTLVKNGLCDQNLKL